MNDGTTLSVASAVPFVAKAQPNEDPTGQPDASIDAVVTTGALGKSADPAKIIAEAVRILKPGAPLVFCEDMSFGKGKVLDALTSSDAARAFERPEYDDGWATLPLSPVAIGVAVRKRDGDAGNGGGAAKRGDDFEASLGLGGGKRGKRKK